MKHLSRTILGLILVLIFSVTSNAANAPYGFTYSDSANGRTIYKYYKYNSSKSTYVPEKEYYSKGSKMYSSGGTLLTDTYGSGSQYNGFDVSGNFYVITPNLELLKIGSTKEMVLNSGCVRLAYNSDDIATSVVTSSGWISLSTLKHISPVDEGDSSPVAPKSANRVDTYTNAYGEMVFEAFQNGKVKIKLIVSKSGNKVLNATNKVRLTDTLKGAKFLGLDTSYNVYLYEGSTLYRSRYGKWYSAEKLPLSGTYKSFTNNSNGFMSKIVTSQGSYNSKQIQQSNWKASRNYVVCKTGYCTLYQKGKTSSYTLMYKDKVLYLNGKKVAKSVKKYGFTPTKIVYIKGSTLYTAKLGSPKKTTKVKKAKSLVRNKYNIVVKVKLATGKSKKLK